MDNKNEKKNYNQVIAKLWVNFFLKLGKSSLYFSQLYEYNFFFRKMNYEFIILIIFLIEFSKNITLQNSCEFGNLNLEKCTIIIS